MKILLGGKYYDVEKGDLIKTMKTIEPNKNKTKYVVSIDDKKYPVKQIISRSFNVYKLFFTTIDAIRILEKLGFKIEWLGNEHKE